MKNYNSLTPLPFIPQPEIPIYPLSGGVPVNFDVFLKVIGERSKGEHWNSSAKEHPVLSTTSAFTRVRILLPLALS